MKFPVSLLLVFLAVACVSAAPPEVLHDTDHFRFTYRVILPALDGPAKLWLPLASTDAFQTVKVEAITSEVPHQQTHDQGGRNTVLLFAPTAADSGKVIEIRYDVQRQEKSTYISDEENVAPYLQGDRLVPINNTFHGMAEAVLVGSPTDAMAKGHAIYDHVLQRMRYDKTGTGWGKGDAMHACDSRAGNCTDFHSYFIALARAAGIPARFAIGFTIPPDKDHGTIAGYHCWAEFLADGKWVPVDISEASQHPDLAAYYFGHHPANRFEVSQGRDLVVDPLPAGGPINFFVYPLLEINGKETPINTEFSFQQFQ